MSNSNVIVSLVFEEMAEEENLFSFSTGRTSFMPGLYPTIDETQAMILAGIIFSRAERLHCSPMLLHETFIDAYSIEDLSDLPRNLFADAIRYLVGFVGAN